MTILLRAQRVHQDKVLSPISFTAHFMTTCIGFAGMLLLGIWMCFVSSRATPKPDEARLSSEVAWLSGAGDGQVSIGFGAVKVNVEAYNKKREKDIAEASRKLLSLAISLKADLERNPGSGASPEAMRKAKEIEKLAHDVKETMKLNILGPQ
jgi:hypothetical protein